MTELLSCPFCGGEAEKVTSSDGFTSIGCLRCNPLFGVMIQAMSEAVAIEAWNTRAERTCEFIDDSDGEFPPKCSACGYEPSIYECSWFRDSGYEFEGNYCPSCGAKVIGD